MTEATPQPSERLVRHCICTRADSIHRKSRPECVVHGPSDAANAYRDGVQDGLNGHRVPPQLPVAAHYRVTPPGGLSLREFLRSLRDSLDIPAHHRQDIDQWLTEAAASPWRDDAGTSCGIPYENGVHIHADARCWPL